MLVSKAAKQTHKLHFAHCVCSLAGEFAALLAGESARLAGTVGVFCAREEKEQWLFMKRSSLLLFYGYDGGEYEE